jgi:hypothetical protein
MPDAEIYAKMHRQFLEKHHPKTFKQLKDNGQLVEHPEEGRKPATASSLAAAPRGPRSPPQDSEDGKKR